MATRFLFNVSTGKRVRLRLVNCEWRTKPSEEPEPVNGELEMPNVKSMDVFGNENDPDISHIVFSAGDLSIQINLTKEQRSQLASLLSTSVD